MLLEKGMLNFERVVATLPLNDTVNPLGTEEKKCIWGNCSEEIAFSEQKAFCEGKIWLAAHKTMCILY